MKPTKETTIAINTIATLAVATSVVMAATFILFYYLDSSTGIKDAWSTTASFFGGFATLTAAYIASKLFNDWKAQEIHRNKLRLIDLCLNSVSLYEKNLNQIAYLISHTKILAKKTLALEEIVNLKTHENNLDILENSMSDVLGKKIEMYEEAAHIKRNLNRLYKNNKYTEINDMQKKLTEYLNSIDELISIHLYSGKETLDNIIKQYEHALNKIIEFKKFLNETLYLFLDEKYSLIEEEHHSFNNKERTK